MNRDRARELAPIIKAFGDGADIQIKTDIGWTKMTENPCWSSGSTYRIKPEPFECWVNVYAEGIVSYETEAEAVKDRIFNNNRPKEYHGVTLHMVEKTDE